MKLTINKLIANDIINCGMDATSGTNYMVYLDEYLKEYEEKDQKYILGNLDSICDDISSNENVSYFSFEKDEDGKQYFDMVYYWENLLDSTEKIVLKNADLLKIDLDFEDIRTIASDLVDDDEFNDDLIRRLKQYDKGNEL